MLVTVLSLCVLVGQVLGELIAVILEENRVDAFNCLREVCRLVDDQISNGSVIVYDAVNCEYSVMSCVCCQFWCDNVFEVSVVLPGQVYMR